MLSGVLSIRLSLICIQHSSTVPHVSGTVTGHDFARPQQRRDSAWQAGDSNNVYGVPTNGSDGYRYQFASTISSSATKKALIVCMDGTSMNRPCFVAFAEVLEKGI
jgi:hypothetical protein